MTGAGDDILLEVRNLSKSFTLPQPLLRRLRGAPAVSVRALEDVSLTVRRGETLGIVGESGCGKSTLARCLVRLIAADSGSIIYDGIDVGALGGAELRRYNRRVQLVFQDPYSSLNPRLRVGQMLSEVIRVHGIRPAAEIGGRVRELIELVGLPPDTESRYPYEFSGGQRQRIGIARALAIEPECLIADEIVSALDMSVQAQIINLLLDLQRKLHLTVLFVSHDLRVVRFISHRIAVAYLGSIVEIGDTEAIFSSPLHPYTQALLAAAPGLDPSRRSTVDALQGDAPSLEQVPQGCPFHIRCAQAFGKCRELKPQRIAMADGRAVACHLHEAEGG